MIKKVTIISIDLNEDSSNENETKTSILFLINKKNANGCLIWAHLFEFYCLL